VAQKIDAIQCREPKPLGRLRPRVPADLDTICRKCLAKSPRRRYASALELAEDLRRWADGYPIKARQVSAAERLRKWARRKVRAIALLLLGLWLGVSAVGVIEAVSDKSTSAARNVNEQAYQRNTVNRLENELRQARNREAAGSYLLHFLQAEREAREGDSARAGELLDRCPASQRAWEWHHLSNRLRKEGGQPAVFTCDSPVLCVDLSPDGQYLAVGGGSDPADKPQGGEGEVAVWDLETRTKVWQTAVRAPVRGVAFSPDGSRLALASSSENRGHDNEVQVRVSRTGNIAFTIPYPGSHLTALAYGRPSSYGPSSGWLFVAGGDGFVRAIVDGRELMSQPVAFRRAGPRGGTHARLLALGSNPERLALTSPDGRQLFVLQDLMGASPNELPGHENTTIRALAYEPRGGILATAGSDQAIRLYNLNFPNQPAAVLRGHKGAVTGVSFSSDGNRLASCGEDGTVRIWDPQQGQSLLTISGYAGATGVLFRLHTPRFEFDDMMAMSLDELAIIHGKKVTVLAPCVPAARVQPPPFR
jgi:hypothetical protein